MFTEFSSGVKFSRVHLLSINKCLCRYSPNPHWEARTLASPQKAPHALSYLVHTFPSGNLCFFSQHRLVCSRTSYKWSYIVCFCIRFLLLSIMFLWLIPIAVCMSSSFLFTGRYTTVFVVFLHILLMNSCFQFGDSMNKAAVHIVQVFWDICFHFSWDWNWCVIV